MAEKLKFQIRRRLTSKRDRPASPGHVGVADPQRQVPLTYAWAVDGVGSDRSVEEMAQEAGIEPAEMAEVLRQYELIPAEGMGNGFWRAAEARGYTGHNLRRKI